jgi:ABC-type Fe3+ transport system permease subunit
VPARRPSRSSLLAALATGLLAAAFLWPRTRLRGWTAYAPGPPWTEVHLGPRPWKNVVGLTTSYPLALFVGALVASLVLSISLIGKVRHRQR